MRYVFLDCSGKTSVYPAQAFGLLRIRPYVGVLSPALGGAMSFDGESESSARLRRSGLKTAATAKSQQSTRHVGANRCSIGRANDCIAMPAVCLEICNTCLVTRPALNWFRAEFHGLWLVCHQHAIALCHCGYPHAEGLGHDKDQKRTWDDS